VEIAEQRWVAIACMTDSQWQSLRRVMGEPEWAGVTDFDSAAGRVVASVRIDRGIGEWTAQQDAYEVMMTCQQAGVPAGVVQDGVDLAERDPQLAAADFLTKIDAPSPSLGQTWADRLPIHFSRTPCDTYERVRELGEDTAEVLQDWLGMSDAEVGQAGEQGALK
jgi:crotonobetainyl-CoA:carnitine CoA-transferase CaiB-like acyl-CoA transferase